VFSNFIAARLARLRSTWISSLRLRDSSSTWSGHPRLDELSKGKDFPYALSSKARTRRQYFFCFEFIAFLAQRRLVCNSNWLRLACGILIAVLFSAFGFFNGYRDFVNQDIFDTPVLEILLVVITLFGAALALRRSNTPRFLTKRYVLVALFFTGRT
jgi:hypothetical protein